MEDGSVVKAGAVLLELEDADAADRYTRTRDSFFLALASEARLQAEALDRPALDYSKELLTAAKRQASVKSIVDGQKQMFECAPVEIRGQFSILEEQHEQLKDELNGLAAERRAANEQIAMTNSELKVVEDLYEKGYTTPHARVFAAPRNRATDGQHGSRLGA